jgi:hypothetical protein
MTTILCYQLAVVFILALAAWYPCCGGTTIELGECASCSGSGDNAPRYLTVTFSGWADSSCTSCASYDGTYVVDGPITTGLGYCSWTWTRTPGTVCGCDSESLEVQMGYGYPLYGMRVIFTQTEGAQTNVYRWRNTFYAAPDCLDWDAYSVAYESRSVGITTTGFSCANSGATCLITSGGTP